MLKIVSFEPVFMFDWVIKVSTTKPLIGICIIMFHRFEHCVRCGYVTTHEEAIDFIEFHIQSRGA